MPNPDRVAADIFRRAKNGTIFSCLFRKRTNNRLRRMVCRLGVKYSEETDNPRLWSPDDKDLMQVFDMQKRAFRFIPLERVKWLKAGGDVIIYDANSHNHTP